MLKLTERFAEVADALGIGATSIVEKDYYVVELLALLHPLRFDSHQLVFAGGTALAKAGIRLNRMSEDVDIKLIPNHMFLAKSRTQRKAIRRQVVQAIQHAIEQSVLFSFDPAEPHTYLDEYRYAEIPIRYPQAFAQSPCLRPFIKLELIESALIEPAEPRSVSSLIFDLTQFGTQLTDFPAVTVRSTLVEKIVSMLRRTAAVARNSERSDDPALVRHVYDHFRITQAFDFEHTALIPLLQNVISADVERFGGQHPQMRETPLDELRFGLEQLTSNPIHQERYHHFVTPMVFGQATVTWQDAYECFQKSVTSLLDSVEQTNQSRSSLKLSN